MIMEDDLVMSNAIYHISVLHHDMLELVYSFLKIIGVLIKHENLINNGGIWSRFGRCEAWFHMLAELFRDTILLSLSHILN